MHAFILGVQAGDGATACAFLAESEKKEFLLGATEVTDVDASSCESAVESFKKKVGTTSDKATGTLQNVSISGDFASKGRARGTTSATRALCWFA